MSDFSFKKLKPINHFTNSGNHHFRVEVQSGAIQNGQSLKELGLKYRYWKEFVGVFKGDVIQYGLTIKENSWPIPNISPLINGGSESEYYRQKQVWISGHLDNPYSITRFVPRKIFSEMKYLDLKVGDFDQDGDSDLAYIVSGVDGLIQSYILYFEPILVEENHNESDIEILEQIMAKFVRSLDKISYKTVNMVEDVALVIRDLAGKESGEIHRRARAHVLMELRRMTWRSYDYCPENSCYPRLLVDINHYLDFVKRHEDYPEILLAVDWIDARIVSPNLYYRIVDRIVGTVDDDAKAAAVLRLFSEFVDHDTSSSPMTEKMLSKLLEITSSLTTEQIKIFLYILDETEREDRPKAASFYRGLERMGRNTTPDTLYSSICRFLKGPKEVSPDQLLKYVELLDHKESRPKIRDLVAAHKTIGPSDAILLAKKFKLMRFGRYHPSILFHMVELAKNRFHDSDKPLILSLVAGYDHSDMFYWGRNFKKDPRARIIVIEVNNWGDFKELPWMVREEYGIPDVLFLTNHGAKNRIDLGIDDDGRVNFLNLKYLDKLKRAFSGFFGDEDGQMLINACSVGGEPEESHDAELIDMNFAQMMADVFHRPVRAARDIEGLLFIDTKVDDKGRASLHPVFFEVGLEWFGFNVGGKTFYPRYGEPPTKLTFMHAADANVGWQGAVGLSVFGDKPTLNAGVGYSHQFYHRLRLRTDLSVHQYLSKFKSTMTIDPEISVGLTNHLMAFASGGIGASVNGGVNPFLQFKGGAKLVFLPNYGELDIGFSTTNGWDPNFYLSYTLRF